MDPLREFLKKAEDQNISQGDLLGLLHILVGRKIALSDGTVVSSGMNWRDVAGILKKVRWDPTQINELGIDPKTLPPRDRERFWLTVINRSNLQSPSALASGERLRLRLLGIGYVVSPAPAAEKHSSAG